VQLWDAVVGCETHSFVPHADRNLSWAGWTWSRTTASNEELRAIEGVREVKPDPEHDVRYVFFDASSEADAIETHRTVTAETPEPVS
jgi:hypothetical protein